MQLNCPIEIGCFVKVTTMSRAIQFNREMSLGTEKIDDSIADGNLPTKLQVSQFSIAQLPPEALLVPGRYFAKATSVLHRARHDPHLNPLPQGEERKHCVCAAGELSAQLFGKTEISS